MQSYAIKYRGIMKNKLKTPAKPRNAVARDLLSPKYKMRVVGNKKKDHRKLAEILGKIAC
jgi:hypothetical protein